MRVKRHESVMTCVKQACTSPRPGTRSLLHVIRSDDNADMVGEHRAAGRRQVESTVVVIHMIELLPALFQIRFTGVSCSFSDFGKQW